MQYPALVALSKVLVCRPGCVSLRTFLCESPRKPHPSGRGDDSLGFAVAVGSGGSAGICLHGVAAALLAPGTALVRLGA